jgi:hypothetical protein
MADIENTVIVELNKISQENQEIEEIEVIKAEKRVKKVECELNDISGNVEEC